MQNLIRFSNENGTKVNISKNTAIFEYPCSLSTSCSPYKISILPGKYKFELYGAQGGDGRNTNKETIRSGSGGRGSYVSGIIDLKTQAHFFLFLGGKGEDQSSTDKASYGLGGYNGGGNGGADLNEDWSPESSAGGGGSSDFRLENEQNMLGWKSRIIVAAGGGGAVSENGYNGSPGGELNGNKPSNYVIIGTQTSGVFGKGLNGVSIGSCGGGSTGGGGGGYYGGSTLEYSELPVNTKTIYSGGSSGSSYISGYHGCDSVIFDESSTVTHTGRRKHYSNYVFSRGTMLSGSKSFNKPGSNEKETGHSGNGAAVITYIGNYQLCSSNNRCKMNSIKLFYYIILI